MKKFAFLLAFFFLLVSSISAVATPNLPSFSSKSVVVASLSTSQILFDTNGDEKFAPGALTQVMTAIVALDKLDIEKTVTVKDLSTYIKQGDSFVNIKEGEQWTVKELVTAMIVGNGDDVAMQLALEVSETIEDFVALMNEKASQLKLQNTKFASPKAVKDDNHYSTANDMAIIAREAFSKPSLQAALKLKTYVLPSTEKSVQRALRTNNYLLDNFLQTKYYYSSSMGGKTGYLGSTVCNTIQYAKKGDSEIIAVVMGGQLQNETIGSLVDAKKALEFAFENFTYNKVVSEGEILADVKLTNARGRDKFTLSADYEVGVFIENGINDVPEKTVTPSANKFKAPIKAGQIFGETKVIYLGNEVGTVPLVATENIDSSAMGSVGGGIGWFFGSWIFKLILIGFVLYLAYYFLYARPKREREIRRQKRRQMIEERLRNK
ncbi:MAG: serine hydrolase [Oscillospiraceae bacterium]|nr:serine hydrolase [Oscillospiraceae bacterium]